MMVTVEDWATNLWGSDVVIPAGTEVVIVPDAGMSSGFAVKSERLLAELTGNTHDPKYRWAFVPGSLVENRS